MAEIDPFENMSPADIAEMTKRLEFTDEPVAPVETGPDTAPIEYSTTVKLTLDLKKEAKRRAKSLGMAQSTYIRWLIERDIAEASMGEQKPAWAREILATVNRLIADDEHRRAS